MRKCHKVGTGIPLKKIKGIITDLYGQQNWLYNGDLRKKIHNPKLVERQESELERYLILTAEYVVNPEEIQLLKFISIESAADVLRKASHAIAEYEEGSSNWGRTKRYIKFGAELG